MLLRTYSLLKVSVSLQDQRGHRYVSCKYFLAVYANQGLIHGDLSPTVRTPVSGYQGVKASAPPTLAASNVPLEKLLAPCFLGSTDLED